MITNGPLNSEQELVEFLYHVNASSSRITPNAVWALGQELVAEDLAGLGLPSNGYCLLAQIFAVLVEAQTAATVGLVSVLILLLLSFLTCREEAIDQHYQGLVAFPPSRTVA